MLVRFVCSFSMAKMATLLSTRCWHLRRRWTANTSLYELFNFVKLWTSHDKESKKKFRISSIRHRLRTWHFPFSRHPAQKKQTINAKPCLSVKCRENVQFRSLNAFHNEKTKNDYFLWVVLRWQWPKIETKTWSGNRTSWWDEKKMESGSNRIRRIWFASQTAQLTTKTKSQRQPIISVDESNLFAHSYQAPLATNSFASTFCETKLFGMLFRIDDRRRIVHSSNCSLWCEHI